MSLLLWQCSVSLWPTQRSVLIPLCHWLMCDVLRNLTELWSLLYPSSHFSNLTWETDIILCQRSCCVCLGHPSVLLVTDPAPPLLSLPRHQANGILSGKACMESNSKTYNCSFSSFKGCFKSHDTTLRLALILPKHCLTSKTVARI